MVVRGGGRGRKRSRQREREKNNRKDDRSFRSLLSSSLSFFFAGERERERRKRLCIQTKSMHWLARLLPLSRARCQDQNAAAVSGKGGRARLPEGSGDSGLFSTAIGQGPKEKKKKKLAQKATIIIIARESPPSRALVR